MVDEFVRECLSIRVARKLSSADVIGVLADLFIACRTPGYIRSDTGREFVATAVKGWISGVGAKPDRLGRNAIDVAITVTRLAEMGVRVHCLAPGGVDLTSPAGRMTMGVINAVAQFERDLPIERT